MNDETELKENNGSVLPSVADGHKDLAKKLEEAKSMSEFKDVISEFNVSMVKRSMVRANTQNDLLDDILEKVKERVENHHDEMSNKELLEYMEAMQNAVAESRKQVSTVADEPPITINNTKNEVNVNIADGMSHESRERVLMAVRKMLDMAKQQNVADAESDIVENEENDI